ncbi:hypothetical protein ACHAW5_008172 [Stephanodiscus triporus]|uniref:Uncharacterized protein n=1 Tax=Stephanodiscus triporus TaxID=2934178 RepID=A0ABD3NBF5_9STRA
MPHYGTRQLTSSPVSASSSLFESFTIIKRGRPVLSLPSMPSGSDNNRRNTSMYYYGDEDGSNLLEMLPRELAAMIESAESSKPSSAPTMSSSLRYYPTYTEGGESCSAKSSTEFNSWEVSYDSLHECCNESFGWDYDACINSHVAEHEDENDLLEMLPRELAAMIRISLHRVLVAIIGADAFIIN